MPVWGKPLVYFVNYWLFSSILTRMQDDYREPLQPLIIFECEGQLHHTSIN